MEKENILQDIVLDEEKKAGEKDMATQEKASEDTSQKHEKKSDKATRKLEKKVISLKEKCKTLENEKNEYILHLQKERAEFDNFRKRKQAEVSSSFQNGVFDTVLKILPVMDNFDLALNNIAEDQKDDDFIKGIQNLSKMFTDTLSSFGVNEIIAQGQPFNHDLHDALMQVDKEEGEEEGIVRQVVQKGYIKDDKVIRYAKVIVTK
jgi:molecular chaperone GrpE